MSSKLTAKQEQFCLEYLKDLNATQAALRAGYKPDNAKQIATENLSKPVLQEKIAELMQERSQRVLSDADWVLKQAKNSFNFNAQQVFDNDGNPKMVNATAASKFLELCGKHTKVKAFADAEVKPVDATINLNFTDAKKPDEC